MCHSRTAVCLRAVLVLVLIGVASSMGALANRVFVSARSGNDANTCDNILAPCQTFAGAVMKLNPGGEAIVLDSGGYGPVTITKSVTIEAPPGVTAFIHPTSGDAISINAGSGTVVLRGLVLNAGPNDGIIAVAFGALYIENCVISGFGNTGIAISAASSTTFLKDTVVRQNQNGGIIFFNGRASVDHCRIEGNQGVGGVQVDGADVTIRDSVSSGNGFGFEAVTLGAENTTLNVYESMATNNNADGVLAEKVGTGSVSVRVANSSFSENGGIGLNNPDDVTFESLGNNFVRGNIFGNTAGTITVVAPK